MKNYYQILEVVTNAAQDEIKEQYRLLAQAWHPDKFPNSAQKIKAEKKLKEINEAYAILRNPAKRAEYDARFTSSNQHSSEDERHAKQAYWQQDRAEAEHRRKEAQWQQDWANWQRWRVEKHHEEEARRQKLSQLDQEISALTKKSIN